MSQINRSDSEIREFLGVGPETGVTTTGVIDLDQVYDHLTALLPVYISRLIADDLRSPSAALLTGIKLGVGLILEQFGITGGSNPSSEFLDEVMRRPTRGAPSSSTVN